MRTLMCNRVADYVYAGSYGFCSSLCVLCTKVLMCSGAEGVTNHPIEQNQHTALTEQSRPVQARPDQMFNWKPANHVT